MNGSVSDSDIRLLRVFIAVVDCGGFAAACARLNVTESTVSGHMSDLEARLGLRLCDRGRGGFRLTDEGRAVHRYATELLHGVEGFRARVGALKRELSGVLRIALADAIYTHPNCRLSQALQRFFSREHNVQITLFTLSPREAEQAVLEGRVDLAISPEHQQIAGLTYQLLFSEQNYLYCGSEHPLFPRRDLTISPQEIAAAGCIGRGYHANFDRGLLEGAQLQATVFGIEAAAFLIRSGRFVGFLPDHFARSMEERGEMRAIQPKSLTFKVPFSVITHSGHSKGLVTTTFLADLEHAHRSQ